MKKLLSLLLVLTLVVALAAGCEQKKEEKKEEATGTEQGQTEGENKEEEKKDEEKKDEEKKEEGKTEESKELAITLVTDTGGIDDKSFNQTIWEGINKFYMDNSWNLQNARYLQSNTEADYVPNLSSFADENVDLIVAPGFKFIQAMTEIAANFPEQKFLLIDAVVEAPNVVSAVFSEHEGSFLVGVAAALKAQEAGKDMVGFLGGEDFPLINKFESGFIAGVKAIAPEMKVEIEYAGSFGDIAKGQTLAAKMYDKGCHVIYHAAGGTGNGLFKEAIDRAKNGQDVWACGVDKDQYADGIYEEGKSVVLTSMLKRADVAAYNVAKSVMDGTFEGGKTLLFDLKMDGVGIPAENPNLKPEWVEEINKFAEKIKSGELMVDEVPERIKNK